MNAEYQKLGEWVIGAAKAEGAGDCRVTVGGGRRVSISYRDRKPEVIKEAATRNLSVEFFVDGRYSSQNTSDLRQTALKDFIHRAIGNTRLLAADKFRTLPDPKYYQGRAEVDLKLDDPDYEKLTPADRHALAKAMEEACWTQGGKRVITVSASVFDYRGEYLTLTSNGFSGSQRFTNYSLSASLTVQDEGDRRPAGWDYAGAVCRRDLPAPEKIGESAVRRTLDMLGGAKIPTMTVPVMVENKMVANLLDGFLGGMFASAIQQKASFLADKKGQKVGSPLFTLVDDPLIASGLGSQLFDGDGIAARRRVMVDGGVLKEFYVDWYYGRKLGWEPTTGAPSNLIIPPGQRTPAEILASLDKCVLVTGFIGGNSNPTTGDASVGIQGKYYEKGKPVKTVAEMNIADNHLVFWDKLIEVANDPYLYGSYRTPSLVFRDVVVSGA